MISNGILLAAGSSGRMGRSKLTLDLGGGATPLSLSLNALARGGLDRIPITVSAATRDHAEELPHRCPVPCAATHWRKKESVSVSEAYAATRLRVAVSNNSYFLLIRSASHRHPP